MVEPQGERYWEGWRDGRTVHARSGNGTKKPRETQKEFADEATAAEDLQARYRKKFREGYIFREAEPCTEGWSRRLMLPVSRLFTGFVSRDYSPQQNLIAVGRPNQSEIQESCDLLLLNADTGTQREVIPVRAFDLQQVCFTSLGAAVYVRTDGIVARLDLANHERSVVFRGSLIPALDFQLSRNGQRILGCDQTRLIVRDVMSGNDLLEVPLEKQRDYTQSCCAALSASGNLAALCEEPGKIQLFDLTSGERRTVTGDFPYAEQLLIHPSERYLVLREHYADMGLWVIDAASGAELTHLRFAITSYDGSRIQRHRCWHTDLSADGTLLARGDGYDIVVHNFETGQEVARLKQEFAVRSHSTEFTFAGTNDTLLSRVDLGIVSVYRRWRG